MSKTLIEYFYRYEKTKADKPYLKQPFGDQWETYTWAEVGEKARRLATWLKKQCPKEKAHVSIISKNCREWIIADIATMMAGFISVPFYATLQGAQLKEVIELGDVDILLIGKVENWDDMKTGIPKDLIVGKFPHYEGSPKIDIGIDWETMLKEEPFHGNPVPNGQDTWSIIFTSGTTGTPKGACFKQETVTKAINMPYISYWFMLEEQQENRFFSYLPLNHLVERTLEMMSIRFGVEVYFVERIDTFTQNLKEARPTMFVAVPRIWTKFKQGVLANMPEKKLNRLLKIPILKSIVKKRIKNALGLGSSRICLTGAAPMSAHDSAWWVKIGIPLSEGYGQTESFAHAAYAPIGGIKSGKVGKAHQEMEIKIAEENNEILIKTPLIMDGYYKDPQKTAETIRDGWLYTGDAGRLHEDGYLSISGRVKDTFKTEKGKFIIPNKVENLYGSNADIEQMCLLGLGMPHPLMFVVPSEIGAAKPKKDLAASLLSTMEKANEQLPNYSKVKTLVITKEAFSVENGLLTPTLKVKRFNVNQKYAHKLKDYSDNEQVLIWE